MNEIIRKVLISSGLKDPLKITDGDTFDSVYMKFSFIQLSNLLIQECLSVVGHSSKTAISKHFGLSETPTTVDDKELISKFNSIIKKQVPVSGDFVLLTRDEILNLLRNI